MTQRVLSPRGTQVLLLDSHPFGAGLTVQEMLHQTRPAADARRPVVLVIGSSAGYGLAATVVALFSHQASCLGVCYERPATQRRSASAGWYRTRVVADAARVAGLRYTAINADTFHPDTKRTVIERLAADFGPIDYLVYSVAAPRRTDPATGVTFESVIKPVDEQHTTKTLTFGDDGEPLVREVTLDPATDNEIAATIKVMGGEDWAAWVDTLGSAGLLAPEFKTVALTYVGSDLTAAIYRNGTIGHAKDHLEATASRLDRDLARRRGAAFTSVNGAVVTQASTAIPSIPLYASLLRAVAGDAMQSTLQQAVRLWEHLLADTGTVDAQGRLRLDDWELDEAIQAQVRDRWKRIDSASVASLADPRWFRTQVRRLYGFDVDGVDYATPVEVDLPWPD